ncbi:MAG TPA: adenylate/guanylate cyclase domain-containing protein [Rhizomicrobium sp.]|nr:adenylate/guanylate cyclase domain-containing protein [Rhizomicrobium sp.]
MAVSDVAGVPRALADRSVSRRAPGRPLVAFFVFVILAVMCGPLLTKRLAENPPQVKGGSVSFANWGPLTTPVELVGQWTLVWHGDHSHPANTRVPINVPGPWKGVALPGGEKLPESGFATYELTIRDLPPGYYTLHVPDTFAASRVWVDGRLQTSVGKVGDSPETTTYLWRAQTIPFLSEGKPVHIAIDIAAFHHRNNGFEETPEIARSAAMEESALVSWTRELIFCISLMMLGVFGIVVFVFRPRDRASLYFGLSAIFTLSNVSVFGRDNLIMVALPGLSFPALLAIIYIPSVLAVVFFVAYANALFPRESPRPIYLTIQFVLACFFLAFVFLFLRGDTMAASHLIVYSIIFSGLTMLYVIAVVAAATIRGRDGGLIFLLGFVAFVVPFLGQLMFRAGVTGGGHNPIGDQFVPIGMLMLLYSHLVIMAERWSVATRSAEEMTVDLRQLIDVSSSITAEIRLGALLRKIVEATSKFVHADRSSLFLHDAKTGDLIAFVAEGLETRQIRFSSKVGLAGHCFTTGEVVNIEDAYSDPRFHRDIDALTGYRTKSVLAMPVIARDGRRLGVMQALNRRDAKAFDSGDIARMSAFAAQAAIAIDNATLFSEVASERNYNESILRSMSNGVLTFDSEGRIAKVNASGATILEIDLDDVMGQNARDILVGGNVWLLDELNGVRADQQPRRLLDVDIVTGGGKTISANVSIVPLMGEGETDNGLLVLFEDITEEKRMEGAMRRFMTQKVVDQVLQRQDELLFGVSCVASVLFADIRNFTTMAEALSARETVDMLNEIFLELVEAVAATDGVLDKFIGDAVMAVFGAPLPSGHDTQNAVDCSVAMMHALAKINTRRVGRGVAELRLGIGLATGDVVAGTIGSPKRMDYTVIGDSVNLASRLQVLTKGYRVSIIICETTANMVREGQIMRELDLIRVRGRKRPEKIYQLMTYHTDQSFPHLKEVLAAYAHGRAALAQADWAAAIEAFEEALRLNPADYPSQLMLERSRVLMKSPPAAGWDGVWSDGVNIA